MLRVLAHVDDTGRRLVKNMCRVKLMLDVIQKVTRHSSDMVIAIISPSRTASKTRAELEKIPMQILPENLKVTTRLQKNVKAEQAVTSCRFARTKNRG